MKVFLTGGSGFLGSHVLEKLRAEGHEILALARSDRSKEKILELGAQPVGGDLTDMGRFKNELTGVDAVVHCTAPMEFWGPWSNFQAGIIDATLQLAELSAAAGVKKFVHISSESVLQDKKPLIDIDESYPYPTEPNSFYGKSKKITEEKLMTMDTEMQITILRPTFIWGVGCPAFTTIKQKAESGEFMWIDQGRSAFEAVHVENVAEAVRLALINSKAQKKIYFVTDGEEASVRSFFTEVFNALGVKLPQKTMPGVIARPLAGFVESLWHFFRIRKSPPLTRFDLAFVAMPRSYRMERIKADLGYEPIMSRKSGISELAARLK